MSKEYILFTGSLIVGVLSMILIMYLIYRRGMAIRITAIIAGCTATTAVLTFALGKEGISLQGVVLCLIFGLPVLVGLHVVMVRQVVTPARQMAETAAAIARGDINQRIDITRQDEIGDQAEAFRQMIVYLQEMADAANRLAQGDLTVHVTPRSHNDALGNALAQMIADLRALVGQVTDSANSVGVASVQLTAIAEQATQATAQVAAAIQSVAAGTAQQAESVTGATTTVRQVTRAIDGIARGGQEQAAAVGQSSEITTRISDAVRQVAANARTGATSAAEATRAARTGANTVNKTIEGMENIKAKVTLSAQRVQEMGRRSAQIDAIVETIDDISSQTNLLALNAAIEAARAGEHGKGFAVVADQVRKLAEESATSTKEIAGLIREIQQAIVEAVKAMEEGAIEVQGGVTLANEAGQALRAILVATESVSRQVEEIAAAAQRMDGSANELVGAMDAVSVVVKENVASTEEIAAGAGDVSQAIEHIASVAEENSVTAEEVSATVEEVNAQVEEVTASAQSLAAMSEALTNLVTQFKLAEDQEIRQLIVEKTEKSGNGFELSG